jgi:hypothetical protein
MTREWHEIKLAPPGEIVETKIDDENGERNHSLLKRSGNLWFVPDGSMYVYYAPTHWRRPPPEQVEQLAREAEVKAKEHLARAATLRKSVRV